MTTKTVATRLHRNHHVLAGSQNTFTSHYMVGDRDDAGRRIILLSEDDAAILMGDVPKYIGWRKSTFKELADPKKAGPRLMADAVRDFNLSEESQIKNLRTAGCGTYVALNLANGLFPVLIKRTQTVDAGSVNPDAYTRPAGGSTGDIDQTAMRELNEELYIRVNDNGRDTMLHIIPDGYQVSAKAIEAIRNERRNRMDSVINAHNAKNNIANMDPALIRAHLELKTPMIVVPGLTEDIVERTSHGDKLLLSRVFCDQASQMDINGVDGITVVDLPSISSEKITGLYDGEMNQKGEFLSRDIKLWTFPEIERALSAPDKQSGKITMSPTPHKTAQAFIGQNVANQALLLAA